MEHSSVLNYCLALEKTPLLIQEGCPKGGVVTEGAYRVTYLPVDREGLPLFFCFS